MCAFFAEDEIFLFDLDEFAIISNWTYDSFSYMHQGWFSEDHNATLYANDEEDELSGTVLETTSYIFDVSDLENPVEVGRFLHNNDTDAFIHPNFDHNFYIKGKYLYQASYTAGARIREIQDDGSLVEVAYFDMEQACELLDFSCDPFLGKYGSYS